jgi:hypothetical protein
VRIHGRDLALDKQFALCEMRRLLLEDPEYQWDAKTGNCRLATMYHFELEGGPNEMEGARAPHRINSNLDLDGLGLFDDHKMHMKLDAMEGRGSTDEELCLPYNDLLGGVHDVSWADASTGGEFEWESFLSFGGDADNGFGCGVRESELLSEQEVPSMDTVPTLGSGNNKRKSVGDVSLDAKRRPAAVPPPSQVAMYGTKPFTWGMPDAVPTQPSARFRLDAFLEKVVAAKGSPANPTESSAKWSAQQHLHPHHQWHPMSAHLMGGDATMGRSMTPEEHQHHQQLMRHHMPLYHHPHHLPHHPHHAHASHHSMPPAPLLQRAPPAMVNFGGDEG